MDRDIERDALAEALLTDLWFKHAGLIDPTPFLRFAASIEREADFYTWFLDAYREEVEALKEGVTV